MRQVKSLTWIIVFLALVILLFDPHPKAASAVPAATITQPGVDATSAGEAVFGFQFRPTIDIYVTQLGMFDAGSDGLANTHWVGLWSNSGTLLASVVLTHDAPGILSAGFRYEDISPLLLEAGDFYRIAVDYAFFDSDHADSDILPLDTHVFNPDIGRLDTASDRAAAPGLTFPSVIGGVTTNNQLSSVLGPNFQFQPVPEPSTMLLLGSGLIGLAGYGRKKFFKK